MILFDKHEHVVGFTGTRKGMTPEQWDRVRQQLVSIAKQHEELVGLHGDCIGADAEFNEICNSLQIATECLPCTLEHYRAFTDARVLSPPAPPMKRNRAIVADASEMLACPPSFEYIPHGSGTWATVRMSCEASVPITVIYPDGTTLSDANAIAARA